MPASFAMRKVPKTIRKARSKDKANANGVAAGVAKKSGKGGK